VQRRRQRAELRTSEAREVERIFCGGIDGQRRNVDPLLVRAIERLRDDLTCAGVDREGLIEKLVVLRVGESERRAQRQCVDGIGGGLELEALDVAFPAFAIALPSCGWNGGLFEFTRPTVSWRSS
jgi:hypothetical protein